MSDLFYNLFKDEILKDEKILWSGQPETSVIFTNADIFLIPFSLLWGGFSIFWEVGVLSTKGKSGQGAPFFFPLFGIPFVLIGLYFIFGRFIYKNFKKKRTYYALTNKRVIILTNTFGKNVQAEFIDRIASMNKTVRANGIGTIRFGSSNLMFTMYGNTGMDSFGSFYGQDVPVFYDIKDVNKVYDIVNGLRKQ
jgi:hypothetical protein